MTEAIDASSLDRAIVQATQAGLPLVPRPWDEVARKVGATPDEVLARVRQMLDSGVIRRIGAVPNHYSIGYRANGMSVWDVDDDQVDALGEAVARSGPAPDRINTRQGGTSARGALQQPYSQENRLAACVTMQRTLMH
jgi:DNA-binding Lrp family transcriptional regulator